jgi:hypothetical protein
MSLIESVSVESATGEVAAIYQQVQAALSITAAEVEALRKLGWSDADILDGLSNGAFMAASDILLNAFQVDRDF